MDLDELLFKTHEYQVLRSELIHEIQQLVSKAKNISEIIYSVTYTDEDIAEQTDFSMDDLIQRLGFVEEDMGYDLDKSHASRKGTLNDRIPTELLSRTFLAAESGPHAVEMVYSRAYEHRFVGHYSRLEVSGLWALHADTCTCKIS